MLGGPTDVYLNGTMHWWIVGSYLIGTPIAAYIYMPIFHQLQIVSVNEVLIKSLVLLVMSRRKIV